MRVLALTKYGPMGASSRMRTLQYVPALRERGWIVDVAPLLDDEYLRALYGRRSVARHVLASYARRLRRLLGDSRHDVVWVEKEVLPWLPAAVELWLAHRGAKLIVDYDDAMFHRYDQHPRWLVRKILGRKIDAIMAASDVVVVGNRYLGDRAHHAGARRVEWVPTVVNLARYPSRTHYAAKSAPVIGWIGSPDTVRFLAPMFDDFRQLAQSRPLRCVAIGARPDQVEGTIFEALPWQEATEVELLHALDIGIMPLQDTLWQRGKCGYKLIQYMACGLPVVASPVGVNIELIEHGRNGFLATTGSQWMSALSALLQKEDLRRSMGIEGRRVVESTYTLQKQTPRLMDIIESAMSAGQKAL